MAKEDIIYDSYKDSTKPKKVEFHFINGECLKLDLEKINVQFKTASNLPFTKNFKQESGNILTAISNLNPEDSIYIRTSSLDNENKNDVEDDNGRQKKIDKERVYLTQRSKIAYLRAAY